MAQLEARETDLDSDLAQVLAANKRKREELARLGEELRALQVERSNSACLSNRLENVVLPAKEAQLQMAARDLQAKVDELSDVKIEVRKSELILRAMESKRSGLDKDLERSKLAWDECVAEWPLTAELGRKKAELAEAEAKVKDFVAEHGNFRKQATTIEKLERELSKIQASSDLKVQKLNEFSEEGERNVKMLQQLTTEIRCLTNRQAAKAKLAKKAMQ